MATMKPVLQRVHLGWILTLFAVGLLGVLMVVGLHTLRPASHDSAPVAVQTDSEHINELREFFAQVNGGAALNTQSNDAAVPGGRVGGISSSDTANDAAIRQGLETAGAGGDLPRSDEVKFYRNQFLAQNDDQVGPGQRDNLAPGSLGAPSLTPPYQTEVNQSRY